MPDLSKFEGLPVNEVGVEMPNAAGGLQEAMRFDPVELHHGEEGYIVLHYSVKKVRHEPIEKDDFTGPQRRVHVLHVDEAALIDADAVEAHMEAQRDKLKKLKDEAKGTPALDLDGEGDLPLGDEDLEAKEIEALMNEGKTEEEARAIASDVHPVNA